jgi:hypothetical protein
MATQVQFRRGTTTQNNAFTGAVGEITYDTEVKTLRLHDGSTAGGGSVVTINAGAQTLTNKTMSTNSVWQGTAVGLAYGGTNANITAAAGAVVYSTSSALGVTSAGTSGQVLTSAGSSSPTWTSQSSLTVGTATTATTATNIAGGSAGQLIIQQDTNLSTFVSAGASGTILQSQGAGYAPTWVSSQITIGSTAVSVGSTSTSLAGLTSIDSTSGATSFFATPTSPVAFAAATTLTIGYGSTASSTTNISTGAVGSGNTKTINIGTGSAAGSTTNINLGDADGGTVTVNKDLVVSGDLAVNGGDITTSATTFNLLNTTATTLNIGGAATTLSIGAATGTATINNAEVVISGNLTVSGTTTTINSTTLTVDDKNIELGSVGTPTDTTANGGGITLKGATDKTLNWVSSTSAWTSSEDFNLLTGKVYEINGTSVLSATTLGSGVTGSSLTSVGTIATGVWNGTAITGQYGGTGVNNSGKTITIGGNFTHSGAHTLTLTTTANTSVTLPTTGTLATLAGAETFTNKTLTSPIISTISNTGTLTLPTSTDTLVGRATTDTLTNKSLTSPTLTGTVNSNSIVYETTFSQASITTQTAVHSFAIATYRSAEYMFQITNGTFYKLAKVLVVHDGTTVTASTNYSTDVEVASGTLNTTYTFDISGGNLRLLVTAASGSATVKGSVKMIVV